jgi:hypothetical protein
MFMHMCADSCMQDVIITSPALPAPLACIVAATTDPLGSLDCAEFLDRRVSGCGW